MGRAKLQADDPNIGFGDLGRKLGEMWHALDENEKEDYRRRARDVADTKMRAWKKKELLDITFSMAPIFGVWRTSMKVPRMLRTERGGLLRKKKELLDITFSMAPIFGVWRTSMKVLRMLRTERG